MAHPQSCKDPDTCTLSYVEHLRGVVIGGEGVTRTPGMRDEPTTVTAERERRWDREHTAYRQLAAAGVRNVDLVDAPRVVKDMGG